MIAASNALANVIRRASLEHDEHLAVGDALTARQEAFARYLVETGNQSAAYRMAYVVGERTLPATVQAAASRIAALPMVRARVRYYQEQAALETIMNARQLFQDCVDIATADPNEIVRVVHRCCRYCHGINFGYQWKNEDEYIDAAAKACEQEAPVPSDSGGYGFHGALEPNPICPHCYGAGISEVVIADTTTLTGKARKLYAGAKQDRHGAIEVKLHDQDKARELVGRILGVFKADLDVRSPEERAKAEAKNKLPVNVTEEEASRAYLQLLG